MAEPLTRREAEALQDSLLGHIMSTATAIEALETLLIAKGHLKDNELMDTVKDLLKKKTEQVSAASESKSILEV